VKFSPDGLWLAATAGPWLRIWKEKGELVFAEKVLESTVAALEWRPDSAGLAVGGYNGVRLFRLKTGVWATQPYEDLKWKGSVLAVAWSPNGRYIAAGSQESTIQFWKLPYRPGEELAMSGYPTKVRELAWDTDSRWLASGGGEIVTVWDVRGRGPAGTRPRQLEGHTAKVACLRFQSRGTVLASGGRDRRVCVWDLSRPDPYGVVQEWEERISTLEWAPDNRAFALGGDGGGVQIWEWSRA
jgi:WD40 repeat protein